MATVASPVYIEPVVPLQRPSASSIPMRQRPRRTWIKWVLLAGIAVALATGAELWRIHSANDVSYETVAVGRGQIQASVTATGTLNAVVDVQVGSQVSGNIKALYADFNTKVTKGQLVAEIDPETFQTQVDQGTAVLASVHAGALTAGAQVQKAKSDLAGAMASEKGAEAVLAKDQANAVNARNQYQRQDTLYQRGLISQQDHDLAKAGVDAAEAQLAADQSQIDAAKQAIQSNQDQLSVTQDQLISAQAQERQSRASLAQTEVNMGHTKITAPVDGTVIARRMDVGQTVAASFSAPTIFEIAQDLTKMQLDTNVDESDIGNVITGQRATFTVDAYPATTFYGEVTAVRKAPISQQNVVTYDVVIAVGNPDLKLFPGMTANARILTAKLDNTLKVSNAVLRSHPTAAMLTQFGLPPAQRGKQELYVKRDGKLQAVPVTFGLSDGKDTAVTASDLNEGDQVVVRLTVAAAGASVGSAPSVTGAGGGRRGPGI
jgi:HlyD family secretion protein